jgi:hypothetical protein
VRQVALRSGVKDESGCVLEQFARDAEVCEWFIVETGEEYSSSWQRTDGLVDHAEEIWTGYDAINASAVVGEKSRHGVAPHIVEEP